MFYLKQKNEKPNKSRLGGGGFSFQFSGTIFLVNYIWNAKFPFFALHAGKQQLYGPINGRLDTGISEVNSGHMRSNSAHVDLLHVTQLDDLLNH